MVVIFELSPPFRAEPKIEKVGPLTRLIWAWFSVAYISGKFRSVGDAFRQDERDACVKACYLEAKRLGEKHNPQRCYDCAEAIKARSNAELNGRGNAVAEGPL